MKTLAMAPYQDSTESYIQINRPFNKCQLKKIIYYESVFKGSDNVMKYRKGNCNLHIKAGMIKETVKIFQENRKKRFFLFSADAILHLFL
jgi:hypothetical protein